MSYVAGFMSDDGVLGRTFSVETIDQAKEVIRQIAEDNKDRRLTNDAIAGFDDYCTHRTRFGIYFIGSLEEV